MIQKNREEIISKINEIIFRIGEEITYSDFKEDDENLHILLTKIIDICTEDIQQLLTQKERKFILEKLKLKPEELLQEKKLEYSIFLLLVKECTYGVNYQKVHLVNNDISQEIWKKTNVNISDISGLTLSTLVLEIRKMIKEGTLSA